MRELGREHSQILNTMEKEVAMIPLPFNPRNLVSYNKHLLRNHYSNLI